MSVTDHTNLPTSPVERTLVARGWEQIDLVERLGSVASRSSRAASLEADRDRARAWYRRPEGVVEAGGSHESDANVVRYRRVTDFISPGERIFEVGIGHGFLAAMMLRDGEAASYVGVDLVPRSVEDTQRVLAANGLSDRAQVRERNLYDLTREEVAASDATLVVCCEVVEHVPDPDAAVRTLAEALPDGTDLLFSVPLVGRLEGVWGHTQVFGAARLHRLLDDAGLVAHHVEVLHDTWAFVLASRSADPSPRAARALEATAGVDTDRFLEPAFRSMTNVVVAQLERRETHWDKRVEGLQVEPCPRVDGWSREEGLRVQARSLFATQGPGKGWASSAGVAFAVPPGTVGARLEIRAADLDDVAEVRLEWRADGERIGLWQWKVTEQRPNQKAPTFLIAPDRRGSVLRRTPGSRCEGADEVEIFVRGREDADIDFRVLRWAWLS